MNEQKQEDAPEQPHRRSQTTDERIAAAVKLLTDRPDLAFKAIFASIDQLHGLSRENRTKIEQLRTKLCDHTHAQLGGSALGTLAPERGNSGEMCGSNIPNWVHTIEQVARQ